MSGGAATWLALVRLWSLSSDGAAPLVDWSGRPMVVRLQMVTGNGSRTGFVLPASYALRGLLVFELMPMRISANC